MDQSFVYVITAAVAIAGISILIQTLLVYGIFRSVKESQTRLAAFTENAEPLVSAARKIVEENRPKVEQIGDKAVEVAGAAVEIAGTAREIAETARQQAARIDLLLTDIVERATVQVARIDGVVGDTAARVQNTTEAIEKTVMKPVREVNGIVTGLRTAISVYSKGKRPSVEHVTQDEEMFI
jgi:methyl-accepting chemotaxis protein